jgi:hypothetical protein
MVDDGGDMIAFDRLSVFLKDGVCVKMVPLTKGVPFGAVTFFAARS